MKRFYTGEPCPKGHVCERFVNGKCVECNAERNKLRPKKSEAAHDHAQRAVAPISKGWRLHATRITAAWRQATQSIIEVGRLLIEAKANLRHGEFQDMIEADLPFGARTAEMLMAIAENPVLSNTNHGTHLPASWRTLYELSKLDDDVLIAKIEDHTIHPGMDRKDVALLFGPKEPKGKRIKPTPVADDADFLTQENADLKAHIEELEAARGDIFVDDDDEPTLARKIVMVIGKERAALLIVELQKLIAR